VGRRKTDIISRRNERASAKLVIQQIVVGYLASKIVLNIGRIRDILGDTSVTVGAFDGDWILEIEFVLLYIGDGRALIGAGSIRWISVDVLVHTIRT
jgi:hypothetical protein